MTVVLVSLLLYLTALSARMLAQLPETAQLYARAAMYSPNPDAFTNFMHAEPAEPALSESQFIRVQSYEEERLNWLNGCARGQIRQAQLNQADHQKNLQAFSKQQQQHANRADLQYIERFFARCDRIVLKYEQMARFQRSRVDISDMLQEYCRQQQEIHNFAVVNDILNKFTAKQLHDLAVCKKEDLARPSSMAALALQAKSSDSLIFRDLFDMHAQFYDTVARKTQQANFQLVLTERIDEKKKKEPETVEEWVEDTTGYYNVLEATHTLDQVVAFTQFMQYVRLEELLPQDVAGSQTGVPEGVRVPVFYYDYQQSVGKAKRMPIIIGLIAQRGRQFDFSSVQAGDCQVLKYVPAVAKQIQQSFAQFVVISDLPADLNALLALDREIALQFCRPTNDLPEMHFTAFSKLCIASFEVYSEFITANLRHIYKVNALREDLEYNWMSAPEIAQAHPELTELFDSTEIILAKQRDQAVFHCFQGDFLREWNDFVDFEAQCEMHYRHHHAGFSIGFAPGDEVVVKTADLRTVLGALKEQTDSGRIVHYSYIADQQSLGSELMRNYCKIHDIEYNIEKLRYFARRDDEIAAMDPKKRPAQKKAEKVVWQAQSSADSLPFLAQNKTLLRFGEAVQRDRRFVAEAEQQFEVYFLITQLLIHYQKHEDFAALSSDVEHQFSLHFQQVVEELNSVLGYCCALNQQQRTQDILIADQLITLNAAVQQALDGFQLLYSRTATEFKQTAEGILQINKKLPQGAIHFANEIISQYLNEDADNAQECSTTRDSSARNKAQAGKAQFNYRDIKLNNFNQFIAMFFVLLIKKLVFELSSWQRQYISTYTLLIYLTSQHQNLNSVYPVVQQDLEKVGQKALKQFEQQIKELSAEGVMAAFDDSVPSDGITLDKYLLSVQQQYDRLPSAFASSIFVPDTNEVVSIKLGPNFTAILERMKQDFAGRLKAKIVRIRQLMTDYSQGIVNVIKQTLKTQETQFTNYEQAVGQIGRIIQKQIEAQEFVEHIDIVGQYQVQMRKEKTSVVQGCESGAMQLSGAVATDETGLARSE